MKGEIVNDSEDITKYAGYVSESFSEAEGTIAVFNSLINTKMAKIQATHAGYKNCSVDENECILIIP